MRPARSAAIRDTAVALIGGAAFLLAASHAEADVLEIGPQGEVSVYSQPTVFTRAGATPILIRPVASPLRISAPQGDISTFIAEASQRYSIPPALVASVAWQESRFRQAAVSGKGAIGVMQLMSGTARGLGVDPYDLRQNIHGGALYLSQMLSRYRGDTALALAAYNAGPGAVDLNRGVPPIRETRNYVAAVLARLGAVPALHPAAFTAAPLAPTLLVFGR